MDDTYPLVDLETGYLLQHKTRDSSPATITRYEHTYKLLHRCLGETPLDIRSLTTETMQRFAIWLRQTPTEVQRGNTKRSEFSVPGHLKGMRAFIRWLHVAR